MSIINIPSIPIALSRFECVFNTQVFTSPLTQATQTNELGGARWAASYTTTRLTRAQASPLKAFLMQLKGQVNYFYGYDPDCKLPLGVATGTPLVMGSSQVGESVVTDGWTPSVTGILKAGDLIQVGTELKMVTADINSNASGVATIPIRPSIRQSPADNSPIVTNTPKCIMRLMDDSQASWEADNLGLVVITFSGIEAINV